MPQDVTPSVDADVPPQAYDDAIARSDGAGVVDAINRMLTGGAEPVTVLTDVIAAAQREVGERWQRGEWTVAQEHAATALAIGATKAVSRWVKRTPTTRGRVVVACAEREWHALPAMIIECSLRADGWDTTLLGASSTPLRLNKLLQDLGPEGVAVSCSVLGALPTSRRFIEASTSAGVPILVGGPAFGPDDLRARALGATAWAKDAHGAVRAMRDLPAVVEPAAPLPEEAVSEQAALDLDHRRIIGQLSTAWSVAVDVDTAGSTVQLEPDEVNDVLNQTLHAVSAALLTGDPRPVPETAAWIDDLLRDRGAGQGHVAELGGLLATALRDYPLASGIVAEGFVPVRI
ncbi:cobalamin B12-binding domain-containing protein [Mycolicibacterium sediminis]|uniref:Cobalamin-binding protein n=1 Tax=Mycolicibacterium sediminis TaxID=1286180 RepID=A0A7I7QZB2_9MYCO|nr:cobalamin B12-binding domain-containing protein [Mycolicibacterium sediminis]BBY31681.1 cobalamin-binding protein [Mycolicibacterium sediminis]